MAFHDTQNPGIGGLDELTNAEEAFISSFVGLPYQQGDVLYYDGTKLNRLPAGTSGQVLKTQGAGANPIWGSGGTSTDNGTVHRTGGLIDYISLSGGTTITITRSGNFISSINNGTNTWTFTRSGNIIQSWTVT